MRKDICKDDEIRNIKEMLEVSGRKFGDRPAYKFKTEEEGVFKINLRIYILVIL